MSDQALHLERLELIVMSCRQESGSAHLPERGHCFELFRRALELNDSKAWAALERQYRPMVCGWLRARGVSEADTDDLAQEALTRFWRTLSTRPEALHDRFDRVGALLRYLHQCAVSTHLDRIRQAQQVKRLKERCLQVADAEHAGQGGMALEQLCREEEIRRVRTWIDENVVEPVEQRILMLSIDAGMTPAEIQRLHPDQFPDTHTIHRIKERILKRARRALEPAESGT